MNRGVLALFLELVFFACAFGARSFVQWRRTGATGFIRPRRDAPRMEKAGAIGFVVALALVVAGPIAELAGMDRIAFLDQPAAATIGGLLAGAGIALTLLAQFGMGDSWRIGVDVGARTTLVTSGVFTLVRNPIFSAMVLAAVGLALLVPNALTLAAVVVLIGALEIQVRYVEEPYLERVHGDEYARYRSTAGRFVPGVGRS